MNDHSRTMPASFRAALSAALARPTMLDPGHAGVVSSGGAFRPRADAGGASGKPVDSPMEDGGIAVVSIEGPLAQKASECWIFSIDGYDAVTARCLAALADPNCNALVMSFDSPGGSVAGCFEAVRAIRAAADAAAKPIVAVSNEFMASGAYALACAADAIVVPATGYAGSVGVITVVGDCVEANKAEGLNLRVIRSGALKATPHPDEPLTDASVAHVQAQIDALAQVFAQTVAKSRGMSVGKVLALEGANFLGADAVKHRLADRVGNFADAVSLARELAANRKPSGRIAAVSTGARPTMKTVLAALALSEDATEADALASVMRLQSDAKALMASVGKSDPAEALGVIEGLKETAGRVTAIEAQIKAQADAAAKIERDALIKSGKDSGQLTPAVIAKINDEKAPWPTAQIRSFLEVAPIAVALGAETKEPGEAVGTAADWHAMSPRERARVYHEDRPRYDAMKAAAEAAPAPAKQ